MAKSEPKSIQIHLQEGIDGGYQKIVQQITAIAKPVVHSSNDVLILITVDIKFVPDIAALDGVRSIGLDFPKETQNTRARGILECPPLDMGLDKTALDGRGQIITVADTGFDKGTLGDVHPAFQNRVKDLIAISRVGTGQTNDPNGHGTHVAGSAVGNGNSPETGSVTGTAPGAKLIVQSLYHPPSGKLWFPSRSNLMIEAMTQGSWIHSCSFGTGTQELYSAEAEEVDNILFLRPKFLVCNSAGNDGDEKGRVNGAAGMKNGIIVGASYNLQQVKGTTFDEDGALADPANMVAWSNPGPGEDGRIKPDIVAPGVAILSTASRDPDFQTAAKKIAGFTIPGTRRINKGGKAPNDLYWYASGTSMATPLVSGCLAILRQALLERHTDVEPNASLVKALLIHGAIDLSLRGGTYQKKPIPPAPNPIQGHGLVNMERSLEPVLDEANALHGMWEDQVVNITDSVEFIRWTPDHTAAPPGQLYDVVLTLVYTDRAGRYLQSEIVYDVAIQTGPLKGKVYPSPRGDNVLTLKCPDIPADTTFKVLVRAKRLFLAQPQAFSLVWSTRKKQ